MYKYLLFLDFVMFGVYTYIFRGKSLNVQWTGYTKRVPVILFNAEAILQKRSDLKTVGGESAFVDINYFYINV